MPVGMGPTGVPTGFFFIRSWSLTLVVLSPVMFVQALSQALAISLLSTERNINGVSPTNIDRVISALSKAPPFPKTPLELSNPSTTLKSVAK